MKSRSVINLYLFTSVFLLSVHLYASQFRSDLCYFNKGFSLGLFSMGSSEGPLVFGAIGLLTLVGIASLLKVKKHDGLIIFLTTLAAIAGLSNLVDRVVHGGVCDYFQVSLIGTQLHFNINDIVLFIGSILISYSVILKQWKSK